ncbi:MAG: hypothetical protein HYY67_08405 [Thaumarchaeota archaeon]|nr:hypothetical protein [Nitrososphaerota archaeon]
MKPLEAKKAKSTQAEPIVKETSTIIGAISAANELQNIGIIQAYSKIGIVRIWPII